MNTAKYESVHKRGRKVEIKGRGLPKVNRAKLARDIGITRAHMSRILSGKVYPGIKVLSKLSRALRCSLDDMVKVLDKIR